MVTYMMDCQLFRAAEDGDMEPFNAYQDQLDGLVDVDQNTALHIYCSTGEYKDVGFSEYIQQLLNKCPSLLRQANAKGEIPLHVAARHGHSAIVEFLIQRSMEQDGEDLEQMLRMRDKEQNTALHKAAQYGHLDVVQALLREDPDFSSSVNASGETPLYLAARGNDPQHHDLVAKILVVVDTNCNPRALVGPRGRTILHAAVLAGNKTTVKVILERERNLTKETDEDGWTPLHYTAHFGCRLPVVEALLEYDATAAYLTDKERGVSPLHMAAWGGHIDIMKCIISHCPGCLGIVDKRGWNFLHFALLTKPVILLKLELLFNEPYGNKFGSRFVSSMTRNLLDTKDVNGITPFHVFQYGPAAGGGYGTAVRKRLSELGCQAQVLLWDEHSQDLELMKENIEQVSTDIRSVRVVGLLANNPTVDKNELGMEKQVPFNLLGMKWYFMYTEEELRKIIDTHLVVVTLIATVSFTAALTVPGGFKGDKGTAILSHNSAFKAFIITDTFAFVSSLSAVVMHFSAAILMHTEDLQFILLGVADIFTFFAMVMMVIAFSTGMYAVLERSLGIAIAACFIANTFFLTISIFFIIFAVLVFAFFAFCRQFCRTLPLFRKKHVR